MYAVGMYTSHTPQQVTYCRPTQIPEAAKPHVWERWPKHPKKQVKNAKKNRGTLGTTLL
jgi:hypothetical protein